MRDDKANPFQSDTGMTVTDLVEAEEQDIPPEVRMMMTAMDTGKGCPTSDRRRESRVTHRTRAMLYLFCNSSAGVPCVLYTRDACPRGLGFLTNRPLPLGYGGRLDLISPQGVPMRIQCTVSRCREVAPGWFEGAVNFNRCQIELSQAAQY